MYPNKSERVERRKILIAKRNALVQQGDHLRLEITKIDDAIRCIDIEIHQVLNGLEDLDKNDTRK